MSEAKAAARPVISRERMYQTILSPLVTEKATALTERGWCVSGGLAVVETGLEDTFELDLERFDERVYGDTRVYFLRIT